ncbi:hypothetical protein B0H13DRAFT_1859642 [Mycena leptocephala]|nr:hypothetical protein B0H13DRAFT_1859642 [Mycena leptocephala]
MIFEHLKLTLYTIRSQMETQYFETRIRWDCELAWRGGSFFEDFRARNTDKVSLPSRLHRIIEGRFACKHQPFNEDGEFCTARPAWIASQNLPIRNTGNRGPILHQPGDWICLKCNYLNWRRRKVCQTCLPYAEGNGDRVSPTVKTERIVALTSALGQSGFGSTGAAPVPPPPHLCNSGARLSFDTVAQVNRSLVKFWPPPVAGRGREDFRTTLSQIQHRICHAPSADHGHADTSVPSLPPSFLQEITESQALLPSAISSFDQRNGSTHSLTPTTFYGADSAPLSSIWRFDKEEINASWKGVSQTPYTEEESHQGQLNHGVFGERASVDDDKEVYTSQLNIPHIDELAVGPTVKMFNLHLGSLFHHEWGVEGSKPITFS